MKLHKSHSDEANKIRKTLTELNIKLKLLEEGQMCNNPLTHGCGLPLSEKGEQIRKQHIIDSYITSSKNMQTSMDGMTFWRKKGLELGFDIAYDGSVN